MRDGAHVSVGPLKRNRTDVVWPAVGIDREIACYKTVNLFRVLCLLFYVDFFVCYDVNSVNKNQSKYYKMVLAVDFLDYNGSNNGHRDTTGFKLWCFFT